MFTPTPDSVPRTMANGTLAGVVGVIAMTAFQRLVEMPLTGREESYAPATLLEKVLPIAPKRGRARRRLNYAAHFGVGLTWGVSHALIARKGSLRGQRAVVTVFGVIYPGDVVGNAALGLDEPWKWSLQDWTVDIGDKLLLAEVVGLTFDRLRGDAN
ncbi:MAG: hypothetical protein AVDCRST_MAG17-1319 [uncultured Solirubrobacterales bacterium]|uniref:DUF1440 domain-containing protein n=1 Tax=uncultured Solirubrobacterales bacterium TaxID=768556 RepID=A0A6J4SIP5_9ACTN|nr:MAG: hypothetical protein AVDCRST_MAG17-1319 [uncultured Solirubrobacterales bacterium]